MRESRIKNLEFRIRGLPHTNEGQSLFEVVVAIAISALIIVAIVSLATNSIQNSSYSKNKTLAATYVQEANEWLRGQRDSDMSAFVGHAITPTWCLQELSWNTSGACSDSSFITDTIFLREVNFVVTTEGEKNFIESNVTVSWDDAKGNHQITSSTDLSDWRQR